MLTFQDFLRARDRPAFLMRLVSEHRASPLVRQAEIADLYDRRQNKTILEYVRRLYTLSGLPREDFTASNNRLCSNFFARLNTQRTRARIEFTPRPCPGGSPGRARSR